MTSASIQMTLEYSECNCSSLSKSCSTLPWISLCGKLVKLKPVPNLSIIEKFVRYLKYLTNQDIAYVLDYVGYIALG